MRYLFIFSLLLCTYSAQAQNPGFQGKHIFIEGTTRLPFNDNKPILGGSLNFIIARNAVASLDLARNTSNVAFYKYEIDNSGWGREYTYYNYKCNVTHLALSFNGVAGFAPVGIYLGPQFILRMAQSKFINQSTTLPEGVSTYEVDNLSIPATNYERTNFVPFVGALLGYRALIARRITLSAMFSFEIPIIYSKNVWPISQSVLYYRTLFGSNFKIGLGVLLF